MGDEKPLIFPEMDGWKQDGKPQVFSPRTLYGDVDLFWKGRFIWGILDLNDPELQSKFLKAIEDLGKR